LPKLLHHDIIDDHFPKSMMTPQTAVHGRIYRRQDDVVCRLVGHESILVPIRPSATGIDSVYTLSPVGHRVWELIDGNVTVEEIARVLCSEYDVEETVALADVEELLASLEEALLVSRN
jgi:hypothetical protein